MRRDAACCVNDLTLRNDAVSSALVAVKGSIIYAGEPTIPGPETELGPFDPTGRIQVRRVKKKKKKEEQLATVMTRTLLL